MFLCLKGAYGVLFIRYFKYALGKLGRGAGWGFSGIWLRIIFFLYIIISAVELNT